METTSVIHKNVQEKLLQRKNFDFQTKFFWNWLPSSADLRWSLPHPHSPLPNPTPSHSSTARSSKAPRPAGVAVTAPLSSHASRGPLFRRGLGRKRRGRDRGGPPGLRSERSGEGPADFAGECAPTGSPAQPLGGSFAGDPPLPCSAAVKSACTSGSVGSGLPWYASRNPGS